MRENRVFSLLMLVAAFLPLHPGLARAGGSYAAFTLTDAQSLSMESANYRGCMNRAGGVTVNMNDCIGAEYDRLDRRLNASYRTTIRRLSRPRAMALRSEQRAWLATREEICLAEDGGPDAPRGTLEMLNLRFCALSDLKRRIVWIERWR